MPPGAITYSVAQHAHDAAALIERLADGPVVACGSSFGGVCVLELARRRPDLLRGAVLCEPPLPPRDEASLVPDWYHTEFARLRREHGGPEAALFFLRMVLGADGLARLPAPVRARCAALHEQIVLDSDALARYRVDYPSLRAITLPVLLLGGERSPAFFRPTLEALAAALPRAEHRILAGASHMMHADAFRAFDAALGDFAAPLLR